MSRVYYFGCRAGTNSNGHEFLKPWQPGYMAVGVKREERETFPWGDEIDGGLHVLLDQKQGVCRLHHKDGWTALAFWDRTGDSRFNSNSVVIEDTERTFCEMVSVLREHFPEIWNRIVDKFELTLFEEVNGEEGAP